MAAMSRRSFVQLAAVAVAAPAVAARRRPNVLFIAVDDLRPQLGCYGHRQMVSPHLDGLAASGTRFARAYCQQAVCAPTRASLLSGCRPDTTQVYDLNTPLRTKLPDVVTLPQHFRQNGYVTLSRGKIYHHVRRDDPPGWSEEPWLPEGDWLGRGYLDPASHESVSRLRRTLADQNTRGLGPAFESPDVPDGAYADGKIAEQGIADLHRLRDQPFFLALGFHKPHLPFNAPRRYWELYDRDALDPADNPFAPRDCPPIALHSWGELRQYDGIPTNGPLDEATARALIHGYYACTSYCDAQIGRVLTTLDELGLRQNTIVVVWGDHGWNLGEHGLWCKHCNFETSVHSPLILRAPGQAHPGVATAALSEFVDVYPTLCELAGLPLPEHLEGISAVPLLEQPDRPWKRAAFSQYPRGRVMGHSLRTDRWRFTRWAEPGAEPVGLELYDHEDDPGENVNLAGDEAHQATVRELSAMLEAGWRGARP